MMNQWRGKLINLRGVEPSDAEIFFRWNQDGERARLLAWNKVMQIGIDVIDLGTLR